MSNMILNEGDIITIRAVVARNSGVDNETVCIKTADKTNGNFLNILKDNWSITVVEKAKKPVNYYKVLYLNAGSNVERISNTRYTSVEEFQKYNIFSTPLQLLESTVEVRYV